MRKRSAFFAIIGLMGAAAGLYTVKYKVQAMDEQIASMRVQIAEEKTSIHVLTAEWAYLTRPERLRELVEKHLEMQPVQAQQMTEVAELPFPEELPVQVAEEGSMPRLHPIQPVAGIVPTSGGGYVR